MNQQQQHQGQTQQQGPSRQQPGQNNDLFKEEHLQPAQAQDPSSAQHATDVEDDQDRGGDVKHARISRDDNGPAENEGHAGRSSEDL